MRTYSVFSLAFIPWIRWQELLNAYSGTNCAMKYPINAQHLTFNNVTLNRVSAVTAPIHQIDTQTKRCCINHNTQISTRFWNAPRHPITRKYMRLQQTLFSIKTMSEEGEASRIFTTLQKGGVDNKTHHNRAFITMKWKEKGMLHLS